MTGGKASRDKGNRFERACVNTLRAGGMDACRIPLSGAAGGDFTGDLKVTIHGQEWRIECKKRARAWSDLYHWLEGARALFIARDRADTLVVMPLVTFQELVRQAGGEVPAP